MAIAAQVPAAVRLSRRYPSSPTITPFESNGFSEYVPAAGGVTSFEFRAAEYYESRRPSASD
jgi:hypothetical protein